MVRNEIHGKIFVIRKLKVYKDYYIDYMVRTSVEIIRRLFIQVSPEQNNGLNFR